MRETLLFFLYLFACLALATHFAQPLVASGWIEIAPHRLVGRLAQLFAVLALFFFLWPQGLARRESLGFARSRAVLVRSTVIGWFVGVAMLAVLVWLLLELNIRQPTDQPYHPLLLTYRGTQALLGGLLLSSLEEAFFRGALYSAIRRRDGVKDALIWSAGFYALLHFMKPGALPFGMAFDADGAQYMFVHVFLDALQWKNLDSLFALFLGGVLLGMVRERTGHIGWCIGLHAGWVFVIQMTRRATDGNDASSLSFLVGQYDGTVGLLAAFWMGLLLFLYWLVTLGRASTR